MLFYTPLKLNFNFSNYIQEKIDFIKIYSPRNIQSKDILKFKARNYLHNNQLKILLSPTFGTTIENFYKVEFYQLSNNTNNSKLVHTEYWGIPLLNKYFLQFEDKKYLYSNSLNNSFFSNFYLKNLPLTLKNTWQYTYGFNNHYLFDCYANFKNILEQKFTFVYSVENTKLDIKNNFDIIYIKSIFIKQKNSKELKNWKYDLNTLDLSNASTINNESINKFNNSNLEITYYQSLELKDIFITNF